MERSFFHICQHYVEILPFTILFSLHGAAVIEAF